MNNNHDSLTADIIHTFDEASQLLSDSYYADEESELWFCRWRSREYETGAKLVESLMHDDAFMSEDARKTVHDSVDWYYAFLEQRGYAFRCMKLDIVIARVDNAEIVGAAT
jgi:hypothetical protein